MGAAASKDAGASASASASARLWADAEPPASESLRVRLVGSLRYLDAKRFSLEDWKKGLAGAFGFSGDTPLQCDGWQQCECTDGFCMRKQWLVATVVGGGSEASKFRFNSRSRLSKVATYLEYHHVPAHVSAVENFRVHRVVCERDGLAVLQLLRDGTNRFALVSVAGRRYLGSFGSYYSRRGAIAFRGRISPGGGGSHFLAAFVTDGGRHCVHLYRLVPKRQSLEGELALPEGRALLDAAFDPRRGHQVVALAVREADRVHVTRLLTADWSALARCAQEAPPTFLAALDYTPCGTRLVLQLVQHDERLCRSRKLQLLVVLDGDSLQPLGGGGRELVHEARSGDGAALTACIAHSCPTNYRPVFSSCGSLAALPCLDAPAAELRVVRIPPPLDLRHLCRRLIRQRWSSDDEIALLPLPPALIAYLRFESFLRRGRGGSSSAAVPVPMQNLAGVGPAAAGSQPRGTVVLG